jgi:putative ABC transport system permease protein
MTAAAALWRDVADGLRSRPGRTLLAFSGVAIGLFSLALCLGVLHGLRVRSARLAAELGAHSAALVQGPAAGRNEPREARLRRNRLEALRASVPEAEWSGARQRAIGLDAGRHSLLLVRTDEALASVRGWRLREGRFLDAGDVREGAARAVATAAAAERLDWRTGDTVAIGGDVFQLVGILSGADRSGDAIPGISRLGEPALFIPWTAPVQILGREDREDLDTIHLRTGDEAALRRAVATAGRVLAAPDLSAGDAAWITPDTLLSGLRRWQTGIAWGTGALAFLCLALGGTTLMSLLLSDVRHRVPEIGLRLALGARPLDVALLFWAEAEGISLAAAAVALAAATPSLRALARLTDMPFELNPGSALLAAGAALLFGALFSFLPARLAARVSAAEALRND